MTIPTLESIQALNGRAYAMLKPEERSVFDFFAAQGRKFEVEVSIVKNGEAIDLDEPASRGQAEAVMRSRDSKVSVAVGAGAIETWNSRAAQQLLRAHVEGRDAGDRGLKAVANPYDPALQRPMHFAWEEGRQGGDRDH